jgi:hypothetical protein
LTIDEIFFDLNFGINNKRSSLIGMKNGNGKKTSEARELMSQPNQSLYSTRGLTSQPRQLITTPHQTRLRNSGSTSQRESSNNMIGTKEKLNRLSFKQGKLELTRLSFKQ